MIKLYDKTDGGPELVDEIEATHIGCEYGEYDILLEPIHKAEK